MVAPIASSPLVPVLLVVLVAILTALVLTVLQAPVTRATVLAATPWMVVGGLLETLVVTVASGAYRGMVAALLAPPQGHLAALVLGGLTWVPLLEFATLRNRRANVARYLGAAGWGAAVVLGVVVLWRGSIGSGGLLWLVVVPILGAVLAGVAYFLLALADPDPLAYTGLVGLLAVFAHTFDGLAVAVAVHVVGRKPRAPLAAFVADLVEATSLPLPAGWAFAGLKLLGVLLVVLVLARTARGSGTRTYLALGALAAAGLGPGVATLLSVVLAT